MPNTNMLVKSRLILTYSASYAVLALMLSAVVNDPLFHAVFQFLFIAFVCLTYDLFYPYMLLGFKVTQGNMPASQLSSFADLINGLHEHTEPDSLLEFAGKALTHLTGAERTRIFACDTLMSNAPASLDEMIEWMPRGARATEQAGEYSSVAFRQSSGLLAYAKTRHTALFANQCPPAIAMEMQEFDATLAIPAHSDHRLLCLLLPVKAMQGEGNEGGVALLNFFCRQLDIAVERIDTLRRQQLRKETANAEKMALLATLSANIAHEMRTPLSGVRASISGVESYLSDLLEGYRYASENDPERFPDIRVEHVKMLKNTPDRIKGMVDQANTVIDLLLVNLRNRKLERSSFTECSMAACIEEAVDTYPFKRNERQKLEYDIAEDFYFSGIQAMMVYVLFNLLKNAFYSIEAACKGGIKISLQREANGNRLVFTDTGAGIVEEALSRIFEGFFTTKSDGTGAGLAFCKRTLNSFNAEISVASVRGDYTTFTITFPNQS